MVTKFFSRVRKSFFVSNSLMSFVHLEIMRLISGNSQCGVRLRGAPGKLIFFRNKSTDYATLLDCFLSGFHRPTRPLSNNPTILDLGANVGYAMVDLYFRHPGARIFGVELDARNVQVALQNIKGLGMSILHAAVFHKDGQIEYNSTSSFDAFKIGTDETSSSTQIKVQALSVGTILRKFDIRHVDYLKIDIEGEEKDKSFKIHKRYHFNLEVGQGRRLLLLLLLLLLFESFQHTSTPSLHRVTPASV